MTYKKYIEIMTKKPPKKQQKNPIMLAKLIITKQ